MKSHEQLRVGNTIVRCLDTGRFVFRDANDPAQIQTIEETHIPEIIEFLYEWSPSAMKRLRIEAVPQSLSGPHSTESRSGQTKK